MPMSFGGISKSKVATIIVAADGTGDTTDVQIGINMLPAGGGSVYVKEGVYLLTDTITITQDNTSIFGAGNSSIIRSDPGMGSYLLTVFFDNCTIRDLFLDGNDDARIGIFGTKTHTTIENCIIQDVIEEGILIIGGVSGSRITGNKIYNTTKASITLTSNGIQVDNVIITGNFIDNCDVEGIKVWNNVGINTIEHVIITDNIISNCTTGIIITTAGARPIVYINIGENIVYDGSAYGIDINTNSVSNVLILGNILENNVSGAINDIGIGTEIAHNITV